MRRLPRGLHARLLPDVRAPAVGPVRLPSERDLSFVRRQADAGPADDADLAFSPRPGARWSVEVDGWSLHAGVSIPAGDFEGRERLVRYAARPSFALGRLRELPDGRLAYRVRWARSASGPYRIMTPLELMARLAAIVPPPRYPLLTFHGVLAPASRWRTLVVPRPRDAPTRCGHDHDTSSSAGKAPATAPAGRSPTLPGKPETAAAAIPPPPVPSAAVRAVGLLVPLPDPDEKEYSAIIPVERWKQLDNGSLLARASRIDWPSLLRRTFAEDVLACPKCKNRLQVLDVAAKPEEARRQLAEFGFAGDGADVAEPARRESGAAAVARNGGARQPRSPPARAGPGAAGACIRSTQYPTPQG